MNQQFYDWIISEWKQKNEPLVWESIYQSKQDSRMRLWEYKCGKHYIKNIPYTKDDKLGVYVT